MASEQVIPIIANGVISLSITLFVKYYVTKVVESVKLNNSTQLEKIKTELGLVSKTYEVIYDDERKPSSPSFATRAHGNCVCNATIYYLFNNIYQTNAIAIIDGATKNIFVWFFYNHLPYRILMNVIQPC